MLEEYTVLVYHSFDDEVAEAVVVRAYGKAHAQSIVREEIFPEAYEVLYPR